MLHIIHIIMHARLHTWTHTRVYMHARLHTCTNHVQCILALLFFVISRYYYSLLLFIITRYIYSVSLLTLLFLHFSLVFICIIHYYYALLLLLYYHCYSICYYICTLHYYSVKAFACTHTHTHTHATRTHAHTQFLPLSCMPRAWCLVHVLFSCMACTSPSLFHALYMIRLHASSHTYTSGQCRYPHSEYTSMQPVHIIMNAHAECTCMHACIPGVAKGSEYTSMQSVHILRVYMHKPA